MADRDVSHSNSEKLDRLIEAVNGSQVSPGLAGRVSLLERILFGADNSGGLIQQHILIWRIHVWLLSALSAGLGIVGTLAIQHFLGGSKH